jgi:SAM-dependent methyltransferase
VPVAPVVPHAYACPLCRGPLQPESAGERCPRCGEFPRVGGVSVLVPQPGLALLSIRDHLIRLWAATFVAPANSANLALLERVAAPALAPTRGSARPSGLAQVFTRDIGWAFEPVLPYFCEDWAGVRAPVRDRFLHDVEVHAHQRSAALVIGCGAGALVHDLAGVFDASYGVDLSIPSLLLARRMLDGETADCHLRHAGWERVTLQGAHAPVKNAHLVAADTAALPFADESFAVVITQYLLDIVADPAACIREVSRVLAPGGIWINDGLPCSFHGEPEVLPSRTSEAWSARLQSVGFEVLEVDRRDNPHLDFHDRNPWSPRVVHSVLHSIGRKATSAPRSPAASAFEAYFRGDSSSLLDLVPTIHADRQVWAMRRLEPSGETERKLTIGGHQFAVTGDGAWAQVATFLQAIQAARPVSTMLQVLASGATPSAERDVVLALHSLHRAGVLQLR